MPSAGSISSKCLSTNIIVSLKSSKPIYIILTVCLLPSQLGDLSAGCVSASSHFNPFGKTHGAPTDTERHVGDLGNIQSNSTGYAVFSFEDKLLSLNGPLSIIGRSVVVHAVSVFLSFCAAVRRSDGRLRSVKGTDDLGKGGDDESLKTGNAGGRAACGVIGMFSVLVHFPDLLLDTSCPAGLSELA